VNSDIANAKAVWRLTNEALWKARADHLQEPTPENWSVLVTAANRWEIAAAAWSEAINANGNLKTQRAEFVEATTIKLPGGR
jgi:hypothetical protein